MSYVSLRQRLVVMVLAALLSISVAIVAAGVFAADVQAAEVTVGCIHAQEETGECLPGGSVQREGLQRAADKLTENVVDDELGSQRAQAGFGQASQLIIF